MSKIIFQTKRLVVRKLLMEDLEAFHKMQSNPKVMQYADGDVKTLPEHTLELKELIEKYDLLTNNFWIYAVERKLDSTFLGTIALIENKEEYEIGYRFLEEYWGNGYGSEVCKGLVSYTKHKGFKKLVAYVIDKNSASIKILQKLNFRIVGVSNKCEEIHLPEKKYELVL